MLQLASEPMTITAQRFVHIVLALARLWDAGCSNDSPLDLTVAMSRLWNLLGKDAASRTLFLYTQYVHRRCDCVDI